MSWEGKYWGAEGALAEAKRKYEASSKTGSDQVSYASAHHSAAGRAWAEFRYQYKFWYLSWALMHGQQALNFVDSAWRLRDAETDLIRNYDKVDVSCAIWRRWGWLRGGRKARARRILMQIDWLTLAHDISVKPHTRALLIVHALSLGLGKKSDTWKWKLESLAQEAFESGERRQYGRVMKYIGQLFKDPDATAIGATYARSDQ